MRIALVLLAMAVGAVTALSTVHAQQSERGEQILNASCRTCHAIRRVKIQAMDADGWTKTVNWMLEMGADVAKDDLPVLVDYLVLNYGPIPDGPGKEIVLNTCTMCHDLKVVRLGGRPRAEWEKTLIAMVNEGAPLSDDEFPVVLNYLTTNFGPK